MSDVGNVEQGLYLLSQGMRGMSEALERVLHDRGEAGELRAIVTENMKDGKVDHIDVSFVCGGRVVELDHLLLRNGLQVGKVDREGGSLKGVILRFDEIKLAELFKREVD